MHNVLCGAQGDDGERCHQKERFAWYKKPLLLSEYFFVEKVSREGQGPTRHGDAVAGAALRDGGAAQEGRVRHHRGRRHGDPSGHLYA